jgi:predicted metal-dependent peptidase
MNEFKSPAEIVDLARIRMLLKFPFFGSLVQHLEIKPADAEHPVSTFHTDGVTVWYNPDFVKSIKLQHVMTALAKAVTACALHLPIRRGARNREKFQTAADYEVDAILLKHNAEIMQSGTSNNPTVAWDWPASYPVKFDAELSKLVTEQIYFRLPDPPGQPQPQPQPQPQSGGSGSDEEDGDESGSSGGSGDEDGDDEDGSGDSDDSGDPGDESGGSSGPGSGKNAPSLCSVGDSPLTNPVEIEHHESKWDVAVAQAAAVAKAQGNLPGAFSLLAEKGKPKIPWTNQLRPFVTQFARDDFSFRRPLLSAFADSDGEILLPSLFSETLGEVVVGVDTSGSIYCCKYLLDEFLAELAAIHADCRPSKLHFADIDARVYNFRTFGPDEQLDLSVTGGGGTDFRPLFDIVEKRRIEPACLIYFTDMYGTFPAVPPPYPVLWISYSEVTTAPFGAVLQAK